MKNLIKKILREEGKVKALSLKPSDPWPEFRKQNAKRLKDALDAAHWELVIQGLEIEEEEFEEPQVIKDLYALIKAIEEGKNDNYLMRTKNFKRLNLDKDKLTFWRDQLKKPEIKSIWARTKDKIKNWLESDEEGDVASKEEKKKVSWCGRKKGKCCDGGDNNKCGKWVDDVDNKKCICSYEGPCCSGKYVSKDVELNERKKRKRKIEDSKYTKWCKEHGWEEGVGQGCADDALDSEDTDIKSWAIRFLMGHIETSMNESIIRKIIREQTDFENKKGGWRNPLKDDSPGNVPPNSYPGSIYNRNIKLYEKPSISKVIFLKAAKMLATTWSDGDFESWEDSGEPLYARADQMNSILKLLGIGDTQNDGLSSKIFWAANDNSKGLRDGSIITYDQLYLRPLKLYEVPLSESATVHQYITWAPKIEAFSDDDVDTIVMNDEDGTYHSYEWTSDPSYEIEDDEYDSEGFEREGDITSIKVIDAGQAGSGNDPEEQEVDMSPTPLQEHYWADESKDKWDLLEEDIKLAMDKIIKKNTPNWDGDQYHVMSAIEEIMENLFQKVTIREQDETTTSIRNKDVSYNDEFKKRLSVFLNQMKSTRGLDTWTSLLKKGNPNTHHNPNAVDMSKEVSSLFKLFGYGTERMSVGTAEVSLAIKTFLENGGYESNFPSENLIISEIVLYNVEGRLSQEMIEYRTSWGVVYGAQNEEEAIQAYTENPDIWEEDSDHDDSDYGDIVDVEDVQIYEKEIINWDPKMLGL